MFLTSAMQSFLTGKQLLLGMLATASILLRMTALHLPRFIAQTTEVLTTAEGVAVRILIKLRSMNG